MHESLGPGRVSWHRQLRVIPVAAALVCLSASSAAWLAADAANGPHSWPCVGTLPPGCQNQDPLPLRSGLHGRDLTPIVATAWQHKQPLTIGVAVPTRRTPESEVEEHGDPSSPGDCPGRENEPSNFLRTDETDAVRRSARKHVAVSRPVARGSAKSHSRSDVAASATGR